MGKHVCKTPWIQEGWSRRSLRALEQSVGQEWTCRASLGLGRGVCGQVWVQGISRGFLAYATWRRKKTGSKSS